MGAPDPLPWAKSRTVAPVRGFSFIVNRPRRAVRLCYNKSKSCCNRIGY